MVIKSFILQHAPILNTSKPDYIKLCGFTDTQYSDIVTKLSQEKINNFIFFESCDINHQSCSYICIHNVDTATVCGIRKCWCWEHCSDIIILEITDTTSTKSVVSSNDFSTRCINILKKIDMIYYLIYIFQLLRYTKTYGTLHKNYS